MISAAVQRAYGFGYRLIFRLLFGCRFKSFGDGSTIIYPLKINGAQFIEIGSRVKIHAKAWLTAENRLALATPRLKIGDGTSIGHYVTISSVKDVEIGKNVLIADRVYISDNVHAFDNIDIPIKKQPTQFKDRVFIGRDSWIGTNVAIVGAKVGKHCVIGANAVVTRDIPDYAVAVGAPARIIKRYNHELGKWQKVSQTRYNLMEHS